MMFRVIVLMLTTFESCGLVGNPFKEESLVVVRIASAFGEQPLGVILASSDHALRDVRDLWCTHGHVE